MWNCNESQLAKYGLKDKVQQYGARGKNRSNPTLLLLRMMFFVHFIFFLLFQSATHFCDQHMMLQTWACICPPFTRREHHPYDVVSQKMTSTFKKHLIQQMSHVGNQISIEFLWKVCSTSKMCSLLDTSAYYNILVCVKSIPQNIYPELLLHQIFPFSCFCPCSTIVLCFCSPPCDMCCFSKCVTLELLCVYVLAATAVNATG